MNLRQLRRGLYQGARLVGDVQAARSPSTMAKRLARKSVWRHVGRALGRLG